MSTRAQIMLELAQIFDRPKSSVAAVDRVLTEHGLRTRSARGRAAKAMSAEDLANVTIGLMGSWSLRQAPIMVERLGTLPLREGSFAEYTRNEDDEAIDLVGGDTLTAADILQPVISNHYPRDRLPMAPTLTGSFASILERMAGFDRREWCALTLYPETSGAELEFRLGNREFRIAFGEGSRLPPTGIYHTTSVMRTEGFRQISAVFFQQ